MKTLIHTMLALAALLVISSTALASASQIDFAGVTGTGSFHNLDHLTDGVMPAEGTNWKSDTTWSTGSRLNGGSAVYTFDLGNLYTIEDVTLSVDHNDAYRVEYSTDGTNWTSLFTVRALYGLVLDGMDTFSTDASNSEYLRALDFNPVEAKYLRLYSAYGDGKYAVGEFQAFGTASAAATPIPSAAWLLGSGLLGLVGLRKRMRG